MLFVLPTTGWLQEQIRSHHDPRHTSRRNSRAGDRRRQTHFCARFGDRRGSSPTQAILLACILKKALYVAYVPLRLPSP